MISSRLSPSFSGFSPGTSKQLRNWGSTIFRTYTSNRQNSLADFKAFEGIDMAPFDKKDLKIRFVHTPMSSIEVPQREKFWRNFDTRYYAVHENSKPADASIWELPHWMTWLGGVLKNAGYRDVKSLSLYTAVDLTNGIDKDLISREIENSEGDVFLYSPMTPNLHFAYEIAEIVKKRFPSSLNVFGGIVSSPLHEQVAQNPYVDFVVRDRGEFALPALLKNIGDEDKVKQVKNVTFKDMQGELHINKDLYPYINLDELPLPFVDLFPKSVGEKLRYIRQNYAVGCPFKCSFCTIQTIGRAPGYFSIDRVMQEIKAYRRHYGEHHNIYFGDETFTLNSKKTVEICEALKKEGNITYDIQTRLMSLNNRRILPALRDSGCNWVEVGIETLSQKSLHIHKQSTNLAKTKDILRRLKDHGLPVCSFIVNGLPEQTPDEMRETIDKVSELLDEKLLHATYFFGLVPYPGSQMHKEPEKFGMNIKTYDYSLYNEDGEPVYDTQYATSDEIYKVFLEGVDKLGDAMGQRPFLGKELPREFFQNLGKSLTHV